MMRKPTVITGVIRKHTKTKRLADILLPNQIALIDHPDLDEVAATSLLKAKVKAVINCSPTMSGNLPTLGPSILLKHGVPIYDVEQGVFHFFIDGESVRIAHNQIVTTAGVFPCMALSLEHWQTLYDQAMSKHGELLEQFVANTLDYVKKESKYFAQCSTIPNIPIDIANRPVVIVSRGNGYAEDLRMLRTYIRNNRPVLIGVDGGADALLREGYKLDLIIGDMDSVTDQALRSGTQLLVQAYDNGNAPGMKRLETMGLKGELLSLPGTSEDAAMLFAYAKGAQWIITVGSHSHMLEFLEKGRRGMSSTFLVRQKLGSKLIDVKGYSRLTQHSEGGLLRRKWKVVAVLLSFLGGLMVAEALSRNDISVSNQPLTTSVMLERETASGRNSIDYIQNQLKRYFHDKPSLLLRTDGDLHNLAVLKPVGVKFMPTSIGNIHGVLDNWIRDNPASSRQTHVILITDSRLTDSIKAWLDRFQNEHQLVFKMIVLDLPHAWNPKPIQAIDLMLYITRVVEEHDDEQFSIYHYSGLE